MKLAVLSHRFPYPPDRGDCLTLLNLLRVVAPQHTVHLLSLSEREPHREGLRILEELGVEHRTVVLPRGRSMVQAGMALLTGGSMQLAYFQSPEFAAAAAELAAYGPFDCVLAHAVRVVPLAQRIPARRRVFMAFDCLSEHLRRAARHASLPTRLLLEEEARRLARVEREGAEWADEVWMISDEDARLFPTRHRSRLRVVRQGIGAAVEGADWRPDGRTLLFVGRMDVRHNVEAARRLCQRVLPLVRRSLPHVGVRLVGAAPSARVQALSRLRGVEVTGPVRDLSREYANAAALVAPITFSTGVQNKVLEAAAAGLPVVTTTSAARGVGPALAKFLDVSDSDEGLAEACVRLLRNPESARARAEDARAAVRRVFRWGNMLEALEQPHLRPLADESSAGAGLLTG